MGVNISIEKVDNGYVVDYNNPAQGLTERMIFDNWNNLRTYLNTKLT